MHGPKRRSRVVPHCTKEDPNHAQSRRVELPGGGVLTPRRFLQLGLGLGRLGGIDALHYAIEGAWDGDELAFGFLRCVENAQPFETNPIYYLLHEAIYANGPQTSPTSWAAERVVEATSHFDWAKALDEALFKKTSTDDPSVQIRCSREDTAGATLSLVLRERLARERERERAPPRQAGAAVRFTGEMVFAWMAADYAALGPLGPTAALLAAKTDWPPLYDLDALRDTAVPCAALVSYEDIFVERRFSEDTAQLLGDACRVWISNEFQHSAIHDGNPELFARLLAICDGEVLIPS